MVKVFKAPSSFNKTLVSGLPKSFDTRDYPDVGVRFAGYAKKQITENEFLFLPQTRFFEISNSNDGVVRDLTAAGAKKKMYITDVQFSDSIGTESFNLIIFDKVASANYSEKWRTGICKGTTNVHVIFPIPLEITTQLAYNYTTSINDKWVNFSGWIEG